MARSRSGGWIVWLKEPFIAPQFSRCTTWLNSESFFFFEPGSGAVGERGARVWLIHFWDYTDLPSLRALPYIAEWHGRYRDKGLVVIGVHTPRYVFGRQRHLIEWAVRQFGIKYPVAMDDRRHLWCAYTNDCWPTQYLVDAHRRVRFVLLGDGRYDETEAAIQQLLRATEPYLALPPVMRSFRAQDQSGALRSRVTPDLHAGYVRGRFGDPDGYVCDHTVMYEDPREREEGVLYAQGHWNAASDSMRFMGESGHLAFAYDAAGVNAILAPTWDEVALMLQILADPPPKVDVLLDGGPVPLSDAGTDILFDGDRSTLVPVDRPRLYNLVRHRAPGEHELRLAFCNRDVAVYAFSFLSVLQSPPVRGAPSMDWSGKTTVWI